ncbi:MAG: oxygen-independent coproporphyrinogen III oxidase [Bacteroidales bacterium]|nr:oxygen-independent coproporphyrinogen III oxidase [Bacteroidales bacterium]
MERHIIEKYNVPVPRYTSYPPANYFAQFGEGELRDAVVQSNDAKDPHLSFYIHFPYCPRLCHYCACNSYAMPQGTGVEQYIEALHKEIDMVASMLRGNRLISQIHYGGGTPTAMPMSAIKQLNDHLLSKFGVIDRPEIAIECHPAYLDADAWQQLADAGFTRMSIGIQDFNEDVLKTVNRKPPQIAIEQIFEILRRNNISINLDFLYGLPLQTPESFYQTISKAVSLAPDRLVTFSYAHVPWIKKAQLILEKAGLPEANVKEKMFDDAAQLLANHGYVRIGMDHFVKPTDELYLALQNDQLHRNFQGYCTKRTTAQVYAFGVTGISQLETAYAQNTKDIAEYIQEIGEGKIPVKKGYTLTRQQQYTREVIEKLMCNYYIDWREIAKYLNISVDELKSATSYNTDILSDMQNDGILTWDSNTIRITAEGAPFVRNVAASLDPLMKNSTKSFSKPI